MWRLLVKLVQHIWETGEIPYQMLQVVVVLIPKGSLGDYRGIGLLEVVWKLIERAVDEQLSKIELHDTLRGFRAKRGCGMGIMEAKLVQQLVYREQCPLFGICLDLRKTYDAKDRGRCLDILREAGVGPKTIRILKAFWDKAELACRASGYYGWIFKAWRGMIQGGPLSPTIFNLIVDAIVREWMRRLEKRGVDGVHCLTLLHGQRSSRCRWLVLMAF